MLMRIPIYFFIFSKKVNRFLCLSLSLYDLITHCTLESSPKPCKNEASMSYFQQNQSSLLVNSIHHHQQQNFGSTYQQQYYHHSSVINNEQPTTTTTITTGDHNDVSSTTTTTVVFSASQPPSSAPSAPVPPPPPPPPPSSQPPIQQIKNEVKTQLSPIYRRQPNSTSPPVVCSSTNQPYLSTQHVIQTPSTNLDTQSNLHISPTLKTIRYSKISIRLQTVEIFLPSLMIFLLIDMYFRHRASEREKKGRSNLSHSLSN